MQITSEKVKKVAKLATLSLTSEEEGKYSEQLSKILGYVEQLNQADTSNVKPTFNVTGLTDVMREDEPQVCLSQEEALANASKKNDGLFETRGVFEE